MCVHVFMYLSFSLSLYLCLSRREVLAAQAVVLYVSVHDWNRVGADVLMGFLRCVCVCVCACVCVCV